LKSNKLLAKNVGKSDLISLKTSGTTASPLKFYRIKMDVAWDMAVQLRGYAWAGYETRAKLVCIRLFEPNDEYGGVKHRLMRFVKRRAS
jgi:phenylacetate-coenzyme A ligase PaaK-like adenylate-forming protein